MYTLAKEFGWTEEQVDNTDYKTVQEQLTVISVIQEMQKKAQKKAERKSKSGRSKGKKGRRRK